MGLGLLHVCTYMYMYMHSINTLLTQGVVFVQLFSKSTYMYLLL